MANAKCACCHKTNTTKVYKENPKFTLSIPTSLLFFSPCLRHILSLVGILPSSDSYKNKYKYEFVKYVHAYTYICTCTQAHTHI